MGSDLFKGLGIGLVLGAFMQFWSYVPFVGSYIVTYAFYVYLVAGLILIFLGFRG